MWYFYEIVRLFINGYLKYSNCCVNKYMGGLSV